MNLKLLSARCTRLLTLIGLSASAASAFATDSFVVSDIRLEGLQRIEPNTVFSYLPIKQDIALTAQPPMQLAMSQVAN